MLRTTLASSVVLSLFFAAASLRAQSPTDNSVFFTFSQPVTLPQVTLPAGKYLFQLVRSNTNRSTVQVYSGDRAKLYLMAMTIRTDRNDAPSKPEVRFMETSSNVPPAIRTWWYPGMKTGWEFVYPRKQALELAKASREPVLTTAADTPVAQMSGDDLVRVDQSGDNVALAQGAVSQQAQAGPEQQGEIAPAAPPDSSSTAMRSQLPKTASTEPLIVVLSVLTLALGLGMRLLRGKVA